MRNFSQNPPYFQLTLFSDYGRFRYLFFILCLLIYFTIISTNMVIIVTIILKKSLHQPMYIFICCLSVNSLYGSTGLFPRFLYDLLSDTHFISRPSCFTQIYVIYTYASCEFTILGAMAYDRLVAICQPLHYHTKMTLRKVVCLWTAAVVYPAFAIICGLFVTVELPLCGNKLPGLFCTNWHIMENSCVDTTFNDTVRMYVALTTIIIPLLFVLYSYMRILIVCKRGSGEVRGKALQTCVPHMVTFVTYSCSVFIELTLTRLYTNKMDPGITAVLSMEHLIVPSINNPLIYGLKLPLIRAAIAKRVKIKLLSRTKV